jgi:5-formyltetrahydrofolate cyclo-ligase
MSISQKHLIVEKNDLRRKYLNIRKNLSPEERKELSAQLLEIFKTSLEATNFSVVHSFLPIERQGEVDTNSFIDYFKEQQKTIVISKSDLKNNDLVHFIYDDSVMLSKSKWGILEPESGLSINESKIDVVLVPLIVFDKQGNRLGYGKGYYDKFLSLCKPNCIKIGLSLLEPIASVIPTEPTDIKLNYCISPSGLHTFNTSK